MAGELRLRSVADLVMCSPWWMFSMLTRRMKSGWDSWWSNVSSARRRIAAGGSRSSTSTALLGTADGAVSALEHGDEEPFLALEVVVDHPLGGARPRRDLVHARAREAVGRELAGGHVEDLAARSVRVADSTAPSGACSSRPSAGVSVFVAAAHRE